MYMYSGAYKVLNAKIEEQIMYSRSSFFKVSCGSLHQTEMAEKVINL